MNPINLSMFGVIGLVAYGYAVTDQQSFDRFASRAATMQSETVAPPSTETPADFTELNQRARTVLRSLLERQEANAVSALSRCQDQAWPYYSADCLASSNGAAVRQQVRVVGVDRHTQPVVGAKAGPVAVAAWTRCTSQTWPYASADCIGPTGSAPVQQAAPRVALIAQAPAVAGPRLPNGIQYAAMR